MAVLPAVNPNQPPTTPIAYPAWGPNSALSWVALADAEVETLAETLSLRLDREALSAWVSFHSHQPCHFASVRDGLFSVDGTKVYDHQRGRPCPAATFTMVTPSPAKAAPVRWSGVSWLSRGQKIDRIWVATEEGGCAPTPGSEVRLVAGRWQFHRLTRRTPFWAENARFTVAVPTALTPLKPGLPTLSGHYLVVRLELPADVEFQLLALEAHPQPKLLG